MEERPGIEVSCEQDVSRRAVQHHARGVLQRTAQADDFLIRRVNIWTLL